MLGPVEFGVFTSLNSFYTLILTPLGIFTLVTAYYLAQFKARNENYRSRSLLIDMTKWVSLIGVSIGIVIALGSTYLATFLQIPSPTPIIVVAVMIFVGALMTVATGALQGLQKFFALGINNIIGPALRLAFVVGLIALGLGASGALAAQIFAGLITFGIAAVILAPILRRRESGQHIGHGLTIREVFVYAGLVMVGTTCISALTNMDVMIVKHFYLPAEAGQYAAVSVLAKIILFFSGAITTVLFPKAVEQSILQQDSSRIIRQTAAAVAGVSGVLVIGYFIFPGFLIRLLFGPGYTSVIPLVGPFGATMALYALVILQMTYYLAIRKARYIALLVVSTISLVISLIMFHNSLLEVIIIQLINAVAVLLVGELFFRGVISDVLRPAVTKKNISA